jgi:SAM-dependent methyltransferase
MPSHERDERWRPVAGFEGSYEVSDRGRISSVPECDHLVMKRRACRPMEWLSYDSVAEIYERVAVPWFEPMAADLVAAVEISTAGCVLDVGTGTGLTAGLARAAVGSLGAVVGVDPSIAMLNLARARRQIIAVAAMAPGLPFPATSFDAVIANLVISHLPDLDEGLADMVRVLRPGGRLGVTAWAPDPADPADQGAEADEIIASVRSSCGLPSRAPVQGARWEEQLRSRTQLRDALSRAGLDRIDAQLHTYRRTFPIQDYLSGWGGLGRYLRWQAGDQLWREFTDQAAARLRDRFGTTVTSVNQAWVATGMKAPP